MQVGAPSAGDWGLHSLSDVSRGRGALLNPKNRDSSPRSAMAQNGLWGSRHAPPLRWGCRVRVPAAALRLPGPDYLRVAARKARLVLPPGLPAAPRLSPPSPPSTVPRKPRPGQLRLPGGAGRGAPPVRALRLRSPLPTSQPPVGAHVEEAEGCPGLVPELRDFPYRRRGIVQGPGKLPAQVAVAFVLVEDGFEAIADQPG